MQKALLKLIVAESYRCPIKSSQITKEEPNQMRGRSHHPRQSGEKHLRGEREIFSSVNRERSLQTWPKDQVPEKLVEEKGREKGSRQGSVPIMTV